jgi:hypothetical protein
VTIIAGENGSEKPKPVRHDDGVSLTRFWFEFDLDGHHPPVPAPGADSRDAGAVQHQWLSFGAGVTGYDEADALMLLRDLVGAGLPPRIRCVTDGEADRASLGIPDGLAVGNAAWRGVWFPADNLPGLFGGTD